MHVLSIFGGSEEFALNADQCSRPVNRETGCSWRTWIPGYKLRSSTYCFLVILRQSICPIKACQEMIYITLYCSENVWLSITNQKCLINISTNILKMQFTLKSSWVNHLKVWLIILKVCLKFENTRALFNHFWSRF